MATIIEEEAEAAQAQEPTTPQQSAQLSAGEVAASLLDALIAGRDVVYLAADEPRAAEVVRALEGGAGEAAVVYCPPSDALPGDSAPPSPANAGQRAAGGRPWRG